MNYLFLFIIFSTSVLFSVPNLILIGPPGAGKGTFSEQATERYGYCHICSGNIIRNEVRIGSDLGILIKEIVEQGNYIDDHIMFEILKKLINDCVLSNRPLILDGFPRSYTTIEFLVELFEAIGIPKSDILIIHFWCDDAVCAERIQGRIICPSCDAVYNLITKQPVQEGQCDRCGHLLESRIGDYQENVIKRLVYYHAIIEPIIERIAAYGYTVIDFDAKQAKAELLFQKIAQYEK